MYLMKVDPRALKKNPDRSRQTKSTPQADALPRATIEEVGIVEPPVIFPEEDGGNGFVIDAGHRRVEQAIASASLDEQKEVWKKHKPSKADPKVSWWSVAQGLTKARMYARHALALPAMPSARTASCRIWARTSSSRACRVRPSKPAARIRRCYRARR